MRLAVIVGLILALSSSALSQSPDAPGGKWPPRGVHLLREPGVTPPKLFRQVTPLYTQQALRAKIEGNVLLDAVVGVDGRVSAVRITRSLDAQSGLDDAAVEALKQWVFTPGTKGGAAVPVLVSVQLSFSLSANAPADLSLPNPFVRTAGDKGVNSALAGAWVEKTADDAGWRLSVSYPETWTPSEPRAGGGLVAINGRHGRAVTLFEVNRLQTSGMPLNERLSARKLQQFAQVLGNAMATGGRDLRVAGQAQLADRFWTWADILVPSPSAALDNFHVWMFSSTAGDQLIQVSLSVMMPRGSQPDETDDEVHAAGDVFVEMLKRMTIARVP